MYKFIKSDKFTTVEYTINEEIETWGSVLENFQDFLAGCGFVLNKAEIDFKEVCESAHDEYCGKTYGKGNHF